MKNVLLFATTATLLGFIGAASGQSASSSRTDAEQKLAERAEYFIVDVFGQLKIEEFPNYIPPRFIEHFPGMEGTLDGFLGRFEPMRARMPPGGRPRRPAIFTIVDGDISLIVRAQPSKDGKQQIRPEVSRWENGKQVEHWDGYSIYAPPAMPYVAARTANEQRNLDLVLRFWRNVVEAPKGHELGTYIASQYVEHDASLPARAEGGFKALTAAMEERRGANPQGFPRTKFTHTLVDGDLVALLHVKKGEPQNPVICEPCKAWILGLDIMRVRNGKIVEHWADWRDAAP